MLSDALARLGIVAFIGAMLIGYLMIAWRLHFSDPVARSVFIIVGVIWCVFLAEAIRRLIESTKPSYKD